MKATLRMALLALVPSAACAFASPLLADDTGPIPGAVLSDKPSTDAAAPASYTLYAENALTLSALRDVPFLPTPFTGDPAWSNRTDLDIRGSLDLGWNISATYSDRLSVFVMQHTAANPDFALDRDVRNDLREAYLTWQLDPEVFFDFGRINARNGVAYAFNPTDFFRTGSLIATDSLDPRSIRENRLGTVMFRAQTVWDFISAQFIYAPRLQRENPVPDSVPADGMRPNGGLDPEFGNTNHSDRFMLDATFDIAPGIAPQLSLFQEHGRTAAGADFTYSLGQSTIAYFEWSGESQYGVGQASINDCVETGLCPSAVASFDIFPSTSHFRNDAAAGFTYTLPFELTAILEYDYHEAGFDRAEFDNWYSDAELVGTLSGLDPALKKELLAIIWLPRQYAQVKTVEPLSRQTLFSRLQWNDAMISNLTLAAMADADLYDRSAFTELSAEYDLGDAWRVGLYADLFSGSHGSDFGTTPQCATVLFSIARYF